MYRDPSQRSGSDAYTLPSQAEATTVILCGALPFIPQFLKLTKQTLQRLNNSIRSHTNHTEDYPQSLLSLKDSRNIGHWHKSDEPTVRRPTQEYVPPGDLHSVSLYTSEVSHSKNSKGDERRYGGGRASESGTADLGGGIVKSIRIDQDENFR